MRRNPRFPCRARNVDFASLKPLAQREGLLHVVEPHSEVTAADLRAGLALLRRIWDEQKK